MVPIVFSSLLASSTLLRPPPVGGARLVARRSLLQQAAAIAATTSLPNVATAADSDENIEVYFGCGCFWYATPTWWGRNDARR